MIMDRPFRSGGLVDEIAEDVFRLNGTHVNAVLIREGQDLTLIDGGWRGDTRSILRAVGELGHRPEDLRGILITHAHPDHLGAVNTLYRRWSIPVFSHPEEVPNVRRDRVEQASRMDVISRLGCSGMIPWALRLVMVGGLRRITVPQVEPFPRSGALDLPGRPVPVPCPGHTSGHTAYHLPEAGVLVSGDALVTAHRLSPYPGPQMLPYYFHHSHRQALDALGVLGALDAEVIVTGHGDPWRGAPRDAVERAREYVERVARRPGRCGTPRGLPEPSGSPLPPDPGGGG
jgi:glyoxylase-like metal-dependent hydrolase (beta-lactamase superfamily II)